MSAELEVINGRAVAMGVEPAWHRLNKVKVDGPITWEDVENDLPEIASPVYLVPLSEAALGFTFTEYTERSLVVRELDNVVVGPSAGSRWTDIPTREAWELGALTGQPCVSVVSLRGGTQFAFTFDMGGYSVGGVDYDGYLSILDSYDSSWAQLTVNSDTCVVCANTASAAIYGAKRIHKVRHTASYEERMDEVKRAMFAYEASRDEGIKRIETLQHLAVDLRQFDAILDAVIPVPEKAASKTTRSTTLATNAREAVRALYLHSPEVGALKGTGWGVVQAFNTYEQWGAPIRGLKGRSEADVRAERQIDALVRGNDALTLKATERTLDLVTA